MKRKINVLLTAIGCPGGPSIIDSLREDPSIRITGTDMRKNVPGKFLVDAFYVVPPGKSESYITEMLSIVEKEKIDVILPLATFELNSLSENSSLFGEYGCKICISNKEALDISNNKFKLYNKFKKEKFTPEHFIPNSLDDLKNKMCLLGFPDKRVVIKPFVSHGSIGLRIIDNEIDLYDQYINYKPSSISIPAEMLDFIFKERDINDILLSEYLPGKEMGVDLLLDPKSNKVIKGIVRDNGDVLFSEVSNGFIVEEKKLLSMATEIAEEIGLSYVVNFDFKYDYNGEPKLLEINPRMPATSYLATASGLNLPLLSIYLAMNINFDLKPLKRDLRIYSYRGFMVINDLNNSLKQV